MDQFKILLKAVLDSSSIGKSDIAEVQKVLNKYHLNLAADLNKAELIKTVKNIVPELEAELKKITGVDIKINDSAITKAINQVIRDEQRLQTELEKTAKKAEESQKRQEAAQRKLDAATNKKANKIQLSLDDGTYSQQIDKLNFQFQKYGLSVDEAENKTKELKATLSSMEGLSGKNLVSEFEKWQTQIKGAKTQLDQTKLSYDKLKVSESLTKNVSELDRVRLSNRILTWLDKNSKAAKLCGDDMVRLANECKTCDGIRLQGIKTEFDQLAMSARQAGKLGKSFTEGIKDQFRSFTQWVSVTSVTMAAVNSLRKMKDAVYDVNTAMTNLYKVSDETDAKYSQFLDNSGKKAQDLGRSISSLIEQQSNWKKLGFTLDESSKLGEYSSIYANVGEVDDTTAVSDMVTAMKAFNIEATDSITIVDSLNKLGNEFATDAKSLGEGLRNSASSMALAGNDINHTLAMLTGGTEIIQNASEMGNALKILSMRIRGMKGQLEELGEEYENVESVSKIQTQILNRTSGSVNIFNDDGGFKSTYEIIKGIADVWDHISETDQADLLEIIAGKQRGNSIAALLKSFQSGQVEKALEASINSDGSAYEEQNRWLKSLEASTKKYEASFQSLSQTVLNQDFLKFLVDSGTTFNNVLDAIIDKTGVLTPLLTGIGITAFVKNFGWLAVMVRVIKRLPRFFKLAYRKRENDNMVHGQFCETWGSINKPRGLIAGTL